MHSDLSRTTSYLTITTLCEVITGILIQEIKRIVTKYMQMFPSLQNGFNNRMNLQQNSKTLV